VRNAGGLGELAILLAILLAFLVLIALLLL
jgi:hypothetical protein